VIREEPVVAVAEPAAEKPVAVRREPEAAAEMSEPVPAEPKPALAEEIDLPEAAAAKAPADADIVSVARKIEPIKHEPLPQMKVERESFSEAWERHRRMMDAAKYVAQPAEDNPAEYDEPDVEELLEVEEVEEPIMRNPFARRKPAPVKGEPVEAGMGELGIESAAETLIAGGAIRAIFVSPEGDEGAAAAVMVAREVADAGLRVLLIDLTASGAASRPMLDSVSYPGITNLLASEAQFTDAIHTDHYSDCHVMPVGTADPVRAMKAADRLPIIMQSLTSAYDVVVVECGASDAEGIRRLVADGTEIMVSVIEPDDETAATAAALKAHGYGRVMLVSPANRNSPDAPMPGRSAA
jgi:Mrp family chromosome partitioning ATPase